MSQDIHTVNNEARKKIVTIGGGSGQSGVLRHLAHYDLDITALVSIVDDGGSSGRLRTELGVCPPGDLRRCITALAQDKMELQQVFEHRFTAGALAGHTVGNIIIAALEEQTGSVAQAVEAASSWFTMRGRVLPISNQSATLYARLEDGSIIEGETHIDISQHDTNIKIESIYIDPVVEALPAAVSAITEADLIVITIGDLFTSALPNLLVHGVAEALVNTSAKLVYSCNRHTKPGETDHFTVSDYVDQIHTYLPNRKLDYVVVDTTPAPSPGNNAPITELVTYSVPDLESMGVRVVEDTLSTEDHTSIDPAKLAKTLFALAQRI